MRTKKVTRYYCDHCAKGMFKKDAMQRHEVVCYRNHNRVCGRCGGEARVSPERAALISNRKTRPNPLVSAPGECPDCLMAFCIQTFYRADPEEYEFLPHYPREQFNKDRDSWDCFHHTDGTIAPTWDGAWVL